MHTKCGSLCGGPPKQGQVTLTTMGTTILTTVLVPDESSGLTMLPYVTAQQQVAFHRSWDDEVVPAKQMCHRELRGVLPCKPASAAVHPALLTLLCSLSPVLGTRRSW